MIKYCPTCDAQLNIKNFKGSNLTFVPCSFSCFMKELKNWGKPLDLAEVKVQRNMQPKVYRSSPEKKFAKILRQNDINFEFESHIFIAEIRGITRYYLPDFFLPNENVFIEIKGGIWHGDAYPKYKHFVNKIPLVLVTSETLKKLRI